MRPNFYNSLCPDAERISAVDLAKYIEENPLDTTYNAHQIIRHLENALKLRVTISAMVLAALFAGYATVPAGRTFRFVKFEDAELIS
ncbi:hypothetical protein [Cupriavidus necator]|nr:hypothetical protein [Cupriavidus necator]